MVNMIQDNMKGNTTIIDYNILKYLITYYTYLTQLIIHSIYLRIYCRYPIIHGEYLTVVCIYMIVYYIQSVIQYNFGSPLGLRRAPEPIFQSVQAF